jgi:hypothetical protein
VHSKAGAGYTSMVSRQWPWSLGWRGYATDSHADAAKQGGVLHTPRTEWGFPNFPQEFTPPEVVDSRDTAARTKDYSGQPKSAIIANGNPPAPSGSDPDPAAGLDNALPGDIITVEMNGLPHVYYVTKLGWPIDIRESQAKWDYIENKYRLPNGTFIRPDRVYVESWDQGKFPTSTGSSLQWGTGPERTIYKYFVPETYRKQVCAGGPAIPPATNPLPLRALTDASPYTPPADPSDPTLNQCRLKMATPTDEFNQRDCESLKCQPSCADLDFSQCVLPGGSTDWRKAKVYRPAYDIRGCAAGLGTIHGQITFPDPANPPPPPAPPNYDFTATYNWYAPRVDTATPTLQKKVVPDMRVIYQAQTQEIGTDLWAACNNWGFDPPQHFAREYKGAQTGALTDTTLCGPKWGDCSTAKPQERKCFPSKNNDSVPVTFPPCPEDNVADTPP